MTQCESKFEGEQCEQEADHVFLHTCGLSFWDDTFADGPEDEGPEDEGPEDEDESDEEQIVTCSVIEIDARAVILRAVEEGTYTGVTKAFEHWSNPTLEQIKQAVVDYVMNDLSHVLKLED